MTPLVLFGLAALLVLLIPVAVSAWEHKTLPDHYYGILALAGCVFAFAGNGWTGIALGLAGAILCAALLGLAVTFQRRILGRRFLSGGHIKLMGAGAVWCGLSGAVLMLVIALALHVGSALVLRIRKSANLRPHFALSAAGAMLAVIFLIGLSTSY